VKHGDLLSACESRVGQIWVKGSAGLIQQMLQKPQKTVENGPFS
jgi:hypothetical protein